MKLIFKNWYLTAGFALYEFGVDSDPHASPIPDLRILDYQTLKPSVILVKSPFLKKKMRCMTFNCVKEDVDEALSLKIDCSYEKDRTRKILPDRDAKYGVGSKKRSTQAFFYIVSISVKYS